MENVLGLVESEAFQHTLTDIVVHHVRPMEVGGRLVALPPTSMSKGNRCGLIDYDTTCVTAFLHLYNEHTGFYCTVYFVTGCLHTGRKNTGGG